MKAAVRDRFGSEDVVEIRDLEKPVPADDEVLVRVHASSLNLGDWYAVAGRPYVGRMAMGFRKPKSSRLGTDYAGTVDAVGKNVTSFSPGDKVFGGKDGAFAEYVCAREDRSITPMPANVTFEEAAAVPVAALTALQAVRDKAGVEPGQKVLVNGASGGVGTFAVQVAKAYGADVTAVCSTANVETVRSIGADYVVDYTKDDFTRLDERYDVMLDVAGSRPWSACKRVLAPKATVVLIGGPKKNRLLGPIGHVAAMRLRALGSGRKLVFFIAKFSKENMAVLRDLLESGQMTSVIDRTYALDEIADALRYLGEGHARGKVVITMTPPHASRLDLV